MKPSRRTEKNDLDTNQSYNAQVPIDTHQAAKYLGFSYYPPRRSRSTGILAGVPAPKYLKMGDKVNYTLPWLDEWVDQFEPKNNTAQNVS